MSHDKDQDVNHSKADEAISAEDLIYTIQAPVALFDAKGKLDHFSPACLSLLKETNELDCRRALQTYFDDSQYENESLVAIKSKSQLDADFIEIGNSGATLLTFTPKDPATNLFSKTRFIEKINSALDQSAFTDASLLCINLDNFDEFIAESGDDAGDRLLTNIANRLTGTLPDTCWTARVGTARFYVFFPPNRKTSDTANVNSLANQAKDLLSRPFLLDREVAELRANVGWACTENQINALELIRRAELSLEMNTETAGLNDKPYSSKMDQIRKEERGLEFDFRKAIMLNQFELHYQMQLDYSTRKITGFEALIRWNHPERGIIYPDLFIPLAEKSGLIVAMGEWVIKTACKEAVKWTEDIRIAVNVSPIQLQNKNLVNVIEQALSETGLSAKRLEIEITESAEIQNEAESRQCLLKLKELGLSIALDDFGTGYASLSYLRSFPFDKLKIDQSFVRCEENQVQNDLVLQSMFALGKCFGMKTLAEGIETEEHQAKLLNLGCENAQGYLYSRPVPFSETFELLKRFNNSVYMPHTSFENNPSTSAQDDSPKSGLFQIAYISDNTTATSPEQLTLIMKSIHETSKKNNEADNISGALMFNQFCFAQILEGESHVIERTFERIQCDPRHQNIQVLDYRSIETRSFPDWAMAFIGESASNTDQFDQLSIIRGTKATDDRTARLQQVLLQSVYSNDISRKAA